jgi:hypothetical protein
MGEKMIDRKKEFRPEVKVYCIFGDPIKTKNKSVETLMKEYHESMVRLRDKMHDKKNNIL